MAYNIVVTNAGIIPLTNVTVASVPGPGLGAMTGFTPGGHLQHYDHLCTLSSPLVPGAVATFTASFATPATSGAVITNTTYATADQWPAFIYPATDPLPAKTIGLTNLSITRTANITNATPGVSYDETVTVTNNSAVTATNVTVKNRLPANVTFNSATPSGGILTCTWPTLAANGQAIITVNVTP